MENLKNIKFATVCSGIGAAELAAKRVGDFEHMYMAEIDPFASAILRYHYPKTPNYGNFLGWRNWPECELDLVISGTPCQSFSVTGSRRSLNDPRGELTLEFIKYVDAIDPKYIIWENVPGCLSTKDNAFGQFIGYLSGSQNALNPIGTRWANAGFVSGSKRQIAWRILDARYFGLAQGRRRVWLCANRYSSNIRNWACASILFPNREAG